MPFLISNRFDCSVSFLLLVLPRDSSAPRRNAVGSLVLVERETERGQLVGGGGGGGGGGAGDGRGTAELTPLSNIMSVNGPRPPRRQRRLQVEGAGRVGGGRLAHSGEQNRALLALLPRKLLGETARLNSTHITPGCSPSLIQVPQE